LIWWSQSRFLEITNFIEHFLQKKFKFKKNYPSPQNSIILGSPLKKNQFFLRWLARGINPEHFGEKKLYLDPIGAEILRVEFQVIFNNKQSEIP